MPIFGKVSARGRQVAALDRNIDGKNRVNKQRLSKFERKALQQETDVVYIYNVSPIFKWPRTFQGLGRMLLMPRKENERVSAPLVLNKRIVRHYDKGEGVLAHMIEEPIELGDDFLRKGNAEDRNDLTNYGCFSLTNNKLEDLPADARERILLEAETKHLNVCRQKVFEADSWASDPVMRRWICEIHRRCALFLHEEKGRPWVTSRGVEKRPDTKECQFCGYDCKPTAVKCPNCKEIIDAAEYTKMKGK